MNPQFVTPTRPKFNCAAEFKLILIRKTINHTCVVSQCNDKVKIQYPENFLTLVSEKMSKGIDFICHHQKGTGVGNDDVFLYRL